MEFWKKIKYENNYLVSNLGNVKRIGACRKPLKRFTADKKGQGARYIITSNKVTTRYRVDLLVADHFLENPNNYQYLIYLDNDLDNLRADNLKWVSDAEYTLHRLGLTKEDLQIYADNHLEFRSIVKELNLPRIPIKSFFMDLGIKHSKIGTKELVLSEGEQVEHFCDGIRVSNKGYLIDSNNRKYYPKANGIPVPISSGLDKPIRLNVARCVAKQFLPNPSNLRFVVHVNGNIEDASVDNLKWSKVYHSEYINSKANLVGV